jgi:hypothetical protein
MDLRKPKFPLHYHKTMMVMATNRITQLTHNPHVHGSRKIHNRKSEANKNFEQENLSGNLSTQPSNCNMLSALSSLPSCHPKLLYVPLPVVFHSAVEIIPFHFLVASGGTANDYHNIHGNYFYFNEFFSNNRNELILFSFARPRTPQSNRSRS